jgi:ribosome-associated toxin RatA of RatAB toxin-antitoxin module
MFDLVADVESYPAFLPGCSGARIEERKDEIVVASIAMARGPFRSEFTTRNRLERPERITMELERGPFRELHGAWEFRPLGTQGCRVTLTVRFAFESRVADLLLGPTFEALCAHLVDAFVSRAREVCT